MKQRKNKMIRIAVVIILSFSLLLIGGNFAVNKWVNTFLPEILNEDPNREYNIQFDEANIHWFNDYIRIDKIEITPNTKSDATNSYYAKAKIDYFIIEKPSLSDLLQHKQIITSRLEVGNPEIIFYLKEPSGKKIREQSVNNFWKDVFTRLLIKNLDINNAKVLMLETDTNKQLFSIENLNINVSGFEIDTLSLNDPFPVKYENLNVEMEHVFFFIDSIYSLQFARLEMNNSNMSIDSIKLNTSISDDEFLDIHYPKKDLFRLEIAQAQLNRFTWNLENALPEINLSSFVFDHLDFHTLKDKRYLPPAKEKPMLAQLFRELPIQLTIDSFIVKNSSIVYEEQPENSVDTTGQIIFNQFYMTGYNLNNAPGFNRVTEFDIESRFMNEAHLTMAIDFNVFDPDDNFTMRGNIDKLTTLALNHILQPLAGVETQGNIHQTSFSIAFNSQCAEGWLDFEYEDLKIFVMQKDKKKKDWFVSGLGNLLLKKENLKSDPKFKRGEVEFARDPNKSFFSYVWNSVKSGLFDTLVPFNVQNRKERQKRNKN